MATHHQQEDRDQVRRADGCLVAAALSVQRRALDRAVRSEGNVRDAMPNSRKGWPERETARRLQP